MEQKIKYINYLQERTQDNHIIEFFFIIFCFIKIPHKASVFCRTFNKINYKKYIPANVYFFKMNHLKNG